MNKPFVSVEEAVAVIKTGKPIILIDAVDREHEGDLYIPAELCTSEHVNFMVTHGKGLLCCPLGEEILSRLKLPLMPRHAQTDLSCMFTLSVDAKATTTTGISAFERAATIKKLVDDTATFDDFLTPGHVFPLKAMPGGVIERQGHTEAAVDLAKMSGLQPAGVICEILSDDGEMRRGEALEKFAQKHDLAILAIKDLVAHQLKDNIKVKKEVTTELTTTYGSFQIHGFRSEVDGSEHVAISKGPLHADMLCRIHSSCMTGELLKSLKCDCGAQLNKTLELLQEEGGMLIYLNQEGRGIGLINKLKAYALQHNGRDTVEANHDLGFKADEREYWLAAHMLKSLGITAVTLLTNNPKKISGLEMCGIKVTRRSIEEGLHAGNKYYLETKKAKLGHLLNI